MATKTKKANKGLYIFAALLVLCVVGAAVLAWRSDRAAAVIFSPDYLRLVYGLLSLAVAIVTFGLIGDSEAIVKSTNPKGLNYQITGSGAGFFIFFVLLTWGLSLTRSSPYTCTKTKTLCCSPMMER